MKKLLSILIIISVFFSLTSCLRLVGFTEIEYIFLEDIKTIEKIELIKVTERITDDESGELKDYKIENLATVNDIDSFMEEFSYLYCYTFKLLPTIELFEDELAVKITYASGSVEMIGAYGQVYCIDGVYSITETRQYFDEEELYTFIDAYTSSQSSSEI